MLLTICFFYKIDYMWIGSLLTVLYAAKDTIFNLKLCLISILTISHTSITLTRPHELRQYPDLKIKPPWPSQYCACLGNPQSHSASLPRVPYIRRLRHLIIVFLCRPPECQHQRRPFLTCIAWSVHSLVFCIGWLFSILFFGYSDLLSTLC